VNTTCTECPVGCGLKVFTKEDRIVNVWGDPDSAVSHGHLCVKGRYETWAVPRERITQPLVNGQPVTWAKAIEHVQRAMGGAPSWQTGLLVSPRVTNETAASLRKLADKFDRVGTFVAPNEAALCVQPELAGDSLARLDAADGIILLGVQLSRDHGVLAARVRQAVRKRGAKLLIFHSRKSDLDQYADITANVVSLERSFWAKVGATLAGVQRPVIVYGPAAMSPVGVTVLDHLIKAFEAKAEGEGPSLVPVPRHTNSLGVIAAGIEPLEEIGPWLDQQPLSFLHIVASDEPDGGARLLDERHVKELLSHIECVVVQAAYASALTAAATVVLPATIWAEKTGTVTNFEGNALPVRPVVPAPGQARDDKAILENLFA
jgi:predicted molibdopterin-dependent oxidoreductase YjgC